MISLCSITITISMAQLIYVINNGFIFQLTKEQADNIENKRGIIIQFPIVFKLETPRMIIKKGYTPDWINRYYEPVLCIERS